MITERGISFETLMPLQMLTVPTKSSEEDGEKCLTSVQLGVQITNNTQRAFRFSFFRRMIPEVMKENGQIIKRGYVRRRRLAPKESDFPLVEPGDCVTFFPNVRLVLCKDGQLIFSLAAGDGGYWNSEVFKSEIYQVRFSYENQKEEFIVNFKEQDLMMSLFWTGRVSTPFKQFQLVDSRE